MAQKMKRNVEHRLDLIKKLIKISLFKRSENNEIFVMSTQLGVNYFAPLSFRSKS